MIDLMSHLRVEVPCNACASSYFVSADLVHDSQRMLAEGCPGTSTYECPALYWATLLPARALGDLVSALDEVEKGALLSGARRVTLDYATETERPTPAPDDDDRAAIARWEQDGGRTA